MDNLLERHREWAPPPPAAQRHVGSRAPVRRALAIHDSDLGAVVDQGDLGPEPAAQRIWEARHDGRHIVDLEVVRVLDGGCGGVQGLGGEEDE